MKIKTLIDAHVHLDSYSDEIDSVFEEISKHRILTISNAMDIASYDKRCYPRTGKSEAYDP